MRRIIIDVSAKLIRAAVVEDNVMDDLIVERRDTASAAGNVYLGVAECVLPNGLAFVNIGTGRNAVLNLTDKKEPRFGAGEAIIVQAKRDAAGEKGALVSGALCLCGDYLILTEETVSMVGVSLKIKDQDERGRLKAIGGRLASNGYGLVMRTRSEGQSEETLAEEFAALSDKLSDIRNIKRKGVRKPRLIHAQSGVLAELLKEGIDEIIVNDERMFGETEREISERFGWYRGKTELYDRPGDIFAAYNISGQWEALLNRKVWLKCGGFITVEQTEACVVIDVNMGKFAGSGGQRESFLRTNMEAAGEAALQLRLRNLSGVIIIDFINMADAGDERILREHLTKELERDRVKTIVVGMTELGLMQLTRRKAREPLAGIVAKPCAACGGAGMLRNDYK